MPSCQCVERTYDVTNGGGAAASYDAMNSTPAGPAIERILLVSLDNIGDTVFASALVPPLREAFPRARIAVWSKAYAAEVAQLIPGVENVFAADPFWDYTPGRGKGTLGRFLKTMSAVRRARFDVAILANAPWRTAAAVAGSGIDIRIGHARNHNRHFLTHVLSPANRQLPVLAELGRLLEPLAIEPRALRYELARVPLAPTVAQLRGEIGEYVAALHPFASVRNRCVPLPVWIEVAQELAANDLVPLWIGSPADLRELRELQTPRVSRFIDDIGGRLGTLTDTAAALSMAAVFAGHDSGPLHIAGAFGVPVLGVFTPGEPQRTFPQGIGAARMLSRPSPANVSASDLLCALEPLLAHPGALPRRA